MTKLAATTYQCGFREEGPVSYELYSGNCDVVFDRDGIPSVNMAYVTPFRLTGTSRTQVLVNGTSTEYLVILQQWDLSGNNLAPVKATGAHSSSLRTLRGARFDLVAAVNVTSSLTYQASDILASRQVNIIRDGANGEPGAFPSTVFIRCPVKPTKPTGGTYLSPYPTSKIIVGTEQRAWTDAPMSGTDPVWMSRAIFLPTHTTSSPEWSDPAPAVDSTDIEFIWSAKDAPATPVGHPFSAAAASDWSKNPTDATWMAVAVKNNSVWSDWQVVRIKGEKGDAGADMYRLDLDNEMQGIACDASGKAIGSGTLGVKLATSNATVYKGSVADSGWQFTKADTNCTSTINRGTGELVVSAIGDEGDIANVVVTATKGTSVLKATMNLYKVRPGESPSIYSIDTSVSVVSRDKDGNLNPGTVTATKTKTTGEETGNTKEKTLTYMFERPSSSSETVLANTTKTGGTVSNIPDDCTAITFRLYSEGVGSKLLDRERIPIVKDGDDGPQGKPGEDAIVLDLDNEVEEIPCDKHGNPTIEGTLAQCTATVYKGSAIDDGWEFSCENTGCTATIGKTTGVVNVKEMDKDTATVRVRAKKEGVAREAVMSLTKVYPGADGKPATTYSIELSDSAIHKDEAGNLTPKTITAKKLRTTGDDCAYATEGTIVCRRTIAGKTDTHDITVVAAGASEGTLDIPKDCESIAFTLKDSNGKVRDRETVPVVSDGEKGDNAINYKLVVNPTSLTYDLNNSAYVGGKSKIQCKIVKIDGESMTQVELSSLSGFTLQHENYVNGVLRETRNYDGGIDCMTTQFSQIDLVLKKNGIEIDRVSVGVNVTGKNGTSGKNGVWVPPPMLWTDYENGYTFQSGNLNKTPMDDHLDIALEEQMVENPAGEMVSSLVPYKCKEGYTKAADSKLPSKDSKHWQKCDSGVWKFLATDLLLANNARINFLSGQSIRVGEGSKMCGYFGSPVEGAILYTGGDNLGNATYVVYSNGEARWGNANGKRIEMNPANGSLSMFDEGGNLRFSLVGDFVDPANAIPDSISTQPTYTSIALTDSVLRQDPSRLDDVTGMCEPLVVEVLKDLVMDGSSGIATINVPKLNFYINCGENAHPVTGYVYARFCIDVKRNGTVMWHKEYTGTSAYNISKHIEINEEKITVAVSKDDEITVECVLEADMLDIGDGTYTMVGVYGFAPNNKVTASIEYQAMRSMIAQNGFVFSSSSKNYVYFLADKNGILQVGCKANGVTKF